MGSLARNELQFLANKYCTIGKRILENTGCNPLQANVPILFHLNKLRNQGFSEVFREYRNGPRPEMG